jgi:hypothetical protein
VGSLGTNNKGFTLVEALLIVLVVAVIGFGGYYVWQNQRKDDTTKANSTSSTSPNSVTKSGSTDPYQGWKSYCSSLGGLCIKYPSSWTYAQDTSNSGPAGSEVNTITSPSHKVVVVYAPDVQLGGTGVSETSNVVDVTPNKAGDFAVVQLVNTVKTSGSYTADVFATPQDSTSSQDKWTKGTSITNSYTPQWHQFINPKQAGSPRNQLLAVTPDGNPFTLNRFNSAADAQAWLSSSEVKIAIQILTTVSYK